MVERARGLAGVLRERQRSLARALDAAADADVVSTLEAEGARLADELAAAEHEADALAPEQDGLVGRRGRPGRRGGGAPGRPGRRVRAAPGRGGRDGGPGRSWPRSSAPLERDRGAPRPARGPPGRRRAPGLASRAGPRAGRAPAETEQGRHRLQAAQAEAGPPTRATRRLDVAEEALPPGRAEHARSPARADALARALDEARGAAGAELLAGVDGVVGTLLDLVEVDSGWEAAFEAAAGASLAAVVVVGQRGRPGRLSRLRRGRRHRASWP